MGGECDESGDGNRGDGGCDAVQVEPMSSGRAGMLSMTPVAKDTKKAAAKTAMAAGSVGGS